MTFRIAMQMSKEGPVLRSRSYMRELEEHGFADGDFMNAVITKPRNAKHSRKFWAWLPSAFENQMKFDCQERLRAYLIISAGFYHSEEFPACIKLTKPLVEFWAKREPHTFWERLSNGKLLAKWPVSTAYDAMDQAEYETLYEGIVNILASEFGFDVDLWSEIGKEAA